MRRVVVSALTAGLLGCAALPDYHPLLEHGPRAPIRLVGARRALSPERSAQILERLRTQGQTDLLSRQLAFVQAVTGEPLVVGNDVTLLVDGPATYEAMFRAIAAARDHINIETFTFQDDTLGRQFADALIQKQTAGVQVNVIYDAVGSWATPPAFFDRMTRAGVAIVTYRPVEYFADLARRDHRKILIVDGRVAFTGGVNIMAAYSSSSGSLGDAPSHSAPNLQAGWRDTDIEIEGPAVAIFQRFFLETWQRWHGAALAPCHYFPELHHAGTKIVTVIASGPRDEQSLIYLALLSAIANAQTSIHVTMAYFVPDHQLVEELIAARQRGVEITLILPGFSDHPNVLAAGRAHYDGLLGAGVQIYEQRNFLLHAKTAIVDGVWATVGSANMDSWSFLRNNELNAVVLGEQFGYQMEAMFQTDLGRATRVDPERWAKRSAWERLKESWATALGPLL